MGHHTSLVSQLADRFRRKDISSLVYFHTDHFEPWRAIDGAPAIGPRSVEAVHEFCRATERIDFARRLTLFYKPHVSYALRRDRDLLRVDPVDLVGFAERSKAQEQYGREAMGEVVKTSTHDIQLHLHHEHYTATRRHTGHEAKAWFASPLGKSFDAQRLELAIRLSLQAIASETGRSMACWFFVHGQWALNASDNMSCTITNEIEILQRNGCRGDFTFPADYQHANPRISAPYFCRPFDAPKGYDHPSAEPEIACGNAPAAITKFFIWASPTKARQCSLDYMFASNRQHMENTERAAKELIDHAYVGDGRLYIKTHAHSMARRYFEHTRIPVFPHQHPAIQTLLGVVFDAAIQAGISVEFHTVPEVYDLLVSAKAKPEIDLAAVYRPGRKLLAGLANAKQRLSGLLGAGLLGR